MSRASRIYLLVTVFLAIAAIVGGVMLAVDHSRSQPVEIVLCQVEPPERSGQLYIVGAVANPGIYPLREGDTIRALLLDAGVESDADLSQIKIHIPRKGEGDQAQRIDINRAESWLLEALPGIGEVRAQAIIGYRSEHGPFGRIEDLLEVSGIGPATFERIKDYITVSD
ncbi:MAG: ComEA family DNA-binding protein [Dehalococcoidia bacterium]|nr:MAG: ComEA family DNA-binding protein [Dehalococcoidia bacterium]